MAMYVDHLSGGTENSAKTNSKGHITSMNSHYRNFIKFIETQGFNENNCRVTDIDANMAGKYDLYLQGITQSAYTFNHSVKAMRSLMKFLIESNGYQITNHFLKIRLEEENSTNSTITREDFQQLLSCISPKDSIQIDKKGRKRNMYREWLNYAIKLKAYTGRRGEEIFKMRWSDIVYEDNQPIYLVTNNLKSVRLKKNQRFSQSEILRIPIIQELEKLLCEIGMNEKRGSNEYIIAPMEKASRTNMQELASKSFTFFAKKLSREYDITMKQLRSTYITAQEIYSYKQGPKLKQHANFATTLKHYINEIEIVKYITRDRSRNRFKVFE